MYKTCDLINTTPHEYDWGFWSFPRGDDNIVALFTAKPKEIDILDKTTFFKDICDLKGMKGMSFIETKFLFDKKQKKDILNFFKNIKSDFVYLFVSKITADAFAEPYKNEGSFLKYIAKETNKKIYLLGVVRDRISKKMSKKLNVFDYV